MKKKFIISGGMKTTDVDIAIASNAVLQALLDGLDMGGRCEYCRDGVRDGRILLEEGEELLVDRLWLRSLSGNSNVLGRRGRVIRLNSGSAGADSPLRGGTKEGCRRSRLVG